MPHIVPLTAIDPALVEDLLDLAFEPERRTRTAYRIREGTEWLPGLSFAALDYEEYLVGIIQLWPVALREADGRAHPMIMVGPVAVSLWRFRLGRRRSSANTRLHSSPNVIIRTEEAPSS